VANSQTSYAEISAAASVGCDVLDFPWRVAVSLALGMCIKLEQS
jgi:hypothetical protein